MFKTLRSRLLFAVLLLSASVSGASLTAAATPAPAEAERLNGPAWQNSWGRGMVLYEVFVGSFLDSNGDGVGDLKGLINSLDYLNDGQKQTTTDLGVEGLLLLPLFPAGSNYGEDPTDFEKIAPVYGTIDDFRSLIKAAHHRGLKVLIDLPLNQTSDLNPWFLSSTAGPFVPRREWYVWRSDDPGWRQPRDGGEPVWHHRPGGFFFGQLGPDRPDLNWNNSAVQDEMARIAAFWLDLGVDGLRLGGIRYLVETGPGPGQMDTPATHEALLQFSGRLRRSKPGTLLIGDVEAPLSTMATYFGPTEDLGAGAEIPVILDAPMSQAVALALAQSDPGPVAETLRAAAETLPEGAWTAPYVQSRHLPRLPGQLGGDRSRLGLAAALLLTIPGTPILFYGEELGLPSGPGTDAPAHGAPFPWTSDRGCGFSTNLPWTGFTVPCTQINAAGARADQTSLFHRYQAWIRLRTVHSALREGSLSLLSPGAENHSVLLFLRSTKEETLLVAHNFGSASADWGPLRLPAGQLELLLGDPETGATGWDGGTFRGKLPARGSAVWLLK